jgi:hypothetical protein
MQTAQILTTTRGGKWVKAVGGDRNYCALGRHFTTGPTWKWYDNETTARVCVCETCAAKEQS